MFLDKTLRILQKAQERIRDPKHWCQGVLSQITDDGTTQWCARGAICYYGWDSHVDELLCRAALLMGYSSSVIKDGCFGMRHEVVELNNSSDHPTVMAMFDRAQELCRAEILETAETT